LALVRRTLWLVAFAGGGSYALYLLGAFAYYGLDGALPRWEAFWRASGNAASAVPAGAFLFASLLWRRAVLLREPVTGQAPRVLAYAIGAATLAAAYCALSLGFWVAGFSPIPGAGNPILVAPVAVLCAAGLMALGRRYIGGTAYS
jgi:hypothetical protein